LPESEAAACAGLPDTGALNAVEAAVVPPVAPRLDAEKLVVYDLALELHAFASGLVGHPQQRVVKDQLERASLSVVLNVAEGAGRRSKRDKRRFYTYARGSATECAAIADVLRARRLAPARSCDTLRAYSIRVVQLLTKLDASLAR
jgi:four helix bundle protein